VRSVLKQSKGRWLGCLVLIGAVGALAFPSPASAHLERPSYWPDPAPDTSVSPAAGGRVPVARSLETAVTGEGPGEVLVVCRGVRGASSLEWLETSLRRATTVGVKLRPSQPAVHLSSHDANLLRWINQVLAFRCAYHSVQQAVFDAGNNDRIVILPGRYEEPRSRSKPTNDPTCTPSLLQRDASGSLAPSYRYQVTCPNDQNLIFVQGRAVVGEPLETPRSDRRGIPAQELGPCVRCNLQIEGTGPRPEDVVMDAGTDYEGPGVRAKPGGYAKDVVLKVDRADGFVGRNFVVRGAREHGFYSEETDGVLLDRTKFFWNRDYGHLSFTSDHHRVQNCEGFGSGDAVVYPGAAPETGSQATSFYPDAPRKNTIIINCDLHGSALGYSGSMGNAVRITRNHIYGNSTGIASDTLSAAGHPGYPADSSEIDRNFIYSNNLNLYVADPPVDPLVGVPVGTGILYAGMNDARVHRNWIFDNWRDGAMLFSVPDAFASGGGAEGDIFPGVSCPSASTSLVSTSCGNRFFANSVGRAPNGFRFPWAVGMFGNQHAHDDARPTKPNGNDFWWGEFFADLTVGNCWFDNSGVDGTAGSVTGPGQAGRLPGLEPQVLPSDCGRSVGNDDLAKLVYLADCSEGPDADTGPTDCDWWVTPPRPGPVAANAPVGAGPVDGSLEREALRQRLVELIRR
jgi:hypothetical protein